MSGELSCSHGEPAVINNSLIIGLAIEQGAKDAQARRLFLEDGIELDEIKEIRIEFSNILKIDNLWIMSDRLTRLQLSNNIIEKIENLDSLVNLRELDLSFNRIRVMENLDRLVNLDILLLYANEISEIGGIDRSTKLTILNIGANIIQHWDHVMYLRQFSKLRVLNVAGNKCTHKDGYSKYLVAFLPQIEYLNYKMIDDKERKLAAEEYHRTIASLVEKEGIEKAEMEKEREKKERIALLSLSYVENLDGDELFKEMYKHDREGKELLMINDDTRAVYEEHKKNFTGLCFQLYQIGIGEHERRKKESQLFSRIVDEAREVIQIEARATMEKIIERKQEIFGEVAKKIAALKDTDAHLESEILDVKQFDKGQRNSPQEFNSVLTKAWNGLVYREVILHQQMENTIERFKINMADMTNNFLEAARSIFSQMRYAETEYMENLDGIANLYINSFTDQLKMPSRHIDVCGDRDILRNNLTASRDIHLQAIDAREDVMASRLKSWYDSYTEDLAEEESRRNRTQILEISHFFEYQREEFDALELQLYSGTSGGNAVTSSFNVDVVVAAMEG